MTCAPPGYGPRSNSWVKGKISWPAVQILLGSFDTSDRGNVAMSHLKGIGFIGRRSRIRATCARQSYRAYFSKRTGINYIISCKWKQKLLVMNPTFGGGNSGTKSLVRNEFAKFARAEKMGYVKEMWRYRKVLVQLQSKLRLQLHV